MLSHAWHLQRRRGTESVDIAEAVATLRCLQVTERSAVCVQRSLVAETIRG
jgi:hypothetical protein